ncbi:MAG: mechanosensitive ion channel family protein [Candidatus Pacebacteria bacterium]|nr:mechanosensitive ion channel family protein [Candidatus Paceibacterota bacterium]
MLNFITQIKNAGWNIDLWGNSIFEYLVSVGVFVLFLIAFKIFQVIILKRLKKISENTSTDIDDILIEAVQSLKPPFYYFISLYFILPFLTIKESVLGIITGLLLILIVFQVVKSILIVVDYVFEKLANKEGNDGGVKMAYSYLGTFTKILIWVLGLLMVLSNLGVNVTTLVAGLGIGGVAFAFALKGILGDLFASFVIFFDKPFLLGDNIQVGDIRGEVIKIGIKTTRIKSSQGEEIVMSNEALTSGKVHNYRKLEERKAAFSFGVTYETPLEKLKQISGWVEDIISEMENTRFSRAHFNRFDDSALNFDVVYYMEVDDYQKYMDTQQEINFQILEKFEKEGIEMAYPTQVLYQK